MPSVGMRRTSTKVCGVVKGVDGARVLRSGRRIWPGSPEHKLRKTMNHSNDGDEWLPSIVKCSNNKENGWAHTNNATRPQIQISKVKKVKVKDNRKVHTGSKIGSEFEKVNVGVDKMFGLVYCRKKKRPADRKPNLNSLNDSKKFGIQFSRRKRRKLDVKDCEKAVFSVQCRVCCSSGLLASFLHLVFRYFSKRKLSVRQLAAFLFTQSVRGAFASVGIQFLQDITANTNGICKIFRVRRSVPMFSVDFSAVPSCFVNMHLRLAIRVRCLSLEPVNNPLDEDSSDELVIDGEDVNSCGLVESNALQEVDSSAIKVMLHPSVRASKLAGRHSQYRNVLSSRGIQKRRSSYRRRRARNPLGLGGVHKANGALVSDLISSRKNGIPFSSVVSKNKLRRSLRINPSAEVKEASSSVVEVARSVDSSSCTANLLVIESDRGYRLAGVTVALEISDSKEWVLVVRESGLARYSHLAQKSMRPCTFNRITHDIIWIGDESWKLEFPDRKDWLLFKELYKDCSDRNLPSLTSKAIPVPGVHEVFGFEDLCSIPFSRPVEYISIKNDEVTRALAKKTANYDMDIEDEEWLKKFNSALFVAPGHVHLSADNFELMIDAFERAFYSSPDDLADEEAAVNICTDLGSRKVVEAVYGYWMKKRKQRRAALIQVFQQLHQAKKPSLVPKPGLRKKRSFKRQPSQIGRGKQPNLLQDHDTLEEQTAMHNVEAAKASAESLVESAILKRRQAQALMENADLAVYKAAMAMRIAEAASSQSAVDIAEMHFLD